MDNAVIRLHSLTKKYHNYTVLDDLNMNIYQNDIYGFVGQNGAGKTTTMRVIMSLIRPTEGTIEIFHQTDNKQIALHRGRIGTMIESPAFYPYLSAYDNLLYYVKLKGIIDKHMIDEVLEMVGLQAVGKKKYKHFSLGMKQRLGLALALINRPDILILDEPLNGLDPKGIIEFREILSVLNKKHKITIIISSHNLEELSYVATRYGFINNGKMIEEITSEQLLQRCTKYIQLEVDDIQKTTTILEQQLSTVNYEIDQHQTILLYDYIEQSEKVASTLITAGIGIKKMNQTNVSLEKYFLDLIKKEEK